MSARIFCDGCGVLGYEVIAGFEFDMPSEWVAVRLPGQRVEHHYCSAKCLLDSFILPGVTKFTSDEPAFYGVRV